MRMRDPHEIGADLRAWLHGQGLSELELAQKISNEISALSVSQPWLSRIIAGKFRRLTPTVRAICGYANIRIEEAAERDARGATLIEQAINDTWNGSLSHASVLARLIKVGKGLAAKD